MKTPALISSLFFGLLFLFSEKVVSQSEPFGFQFQHYSTRQGLANNQVLSIAEDADGFIWAGTNDGVSRFDGFQFKNFKLSIKDSTANSSRNVVEKIKRVGNEIWAMNRRFELFRFDRSAAAFVFTGLNGATGWAIKQDGNFPEFQFDESRNCIWMVDSKNLVRLSLTGSPPVSFSIFEEGISNGSIVLDYKKRLWLTTESGLVRFEPESGKTTRLIPGRRAICQLRNGPILWFTGDLDSLYRVDLRTDSLARFSTHSAEPMPGMDARVAQNIAFFPALTGDSVLWAGLAHGGILLFNLKTGEEIARYFVDFGPRNGLVNEEVLEFYLARDSVFWAATAGGLLKIDPRQQAFFTTEIAEFKKNSIGKIRAVLSSPQKKGTKWVLSNADGLFELDEKTGRVFNPGFSPSGSSVDLREMTFDSQKNLTVVGKKELLQVFQDGRVRLTNPKMEGNQAIRLFSNINEDSVWLSNRKEIGLFLPRTGAFLPVKNGFSDIYYLNEGAGGSVLVSELNGLFRVRLDGFDRAAGCFAAVEKIELPAGEKEGNDALEDDRFIWIIVSNGLGRLEKSTGKWAIFGEKEGLTNARIRSILKDRQGHLWLNSDNGLFVFFPEENRFKRFSEDDGLVQNLIGGLLSDDGDWFHACFMDSYSSWKPTARLQKVAKTPVFTGFWALNRPVCLRSDSLRNSIFEVRHAENILRFEFTCTDFYQSEKITFEYQLDGFDRQPVAAGTSRSAIYTNLDGGWYSLKVWAINADGYRCTEPAVLRFRVVPPFYRTWWFLGLCLAAVGGIFYAIFQNRLRERLEKEAIRLRIARDLHDEVGSTLTTISILSESALRGVEFDLERTRLTGIGDKARAAISSMSDIVWTVNPQNDSMEKVVERMTRFAVETLENAGISPRFEIEKAVFDLVLPMEKRKEFYLFFKEAATNVAKHSRAREAVFSLKKESGRLVFELKDDGIGLPEKAENNLGGNGLKNMEARAAALSADFFMKNGAESGVFIRLAVPLA